MNNYNIFYFRFNTRIINFIFIYTKKFYYYIIILISTQLLLISCYCNLFVNKLFNFFEKLIFI